jgi:hypothetical protein
MSSNDLSVRVQADGCGASPTVTSRVSVSKPSISTRIVQTPAARSANRKRPRSSVVVTC